MATPKELVAKVAELTGVPEGTVVQHDRNLSVAGLRTVGGRGRAAAQVTYQDAANLLIAVAGSRNVKDSVKTVQEYAELKARDPMVFDDDGRDVIRGRTFGDALAALLEALPADRDSYANPEHGSVDVSIYGPRPVARIEWKVGDRSDTLDYREVGRRDPTPRPFADLQFIARFSQVTIGHVGELVADKSKPG
ncbi:hypothetical protein [Aquamicrobium zhengzhouense]|uniref:Uncharacterized protein n=1 Tax=Aquamicrobium zhengzhouense TaxID=2781738 RepID=A0ABS0SC05_9HYPH|nr:hypothetical protein [Aquamicrobium zhengzhouense]MBI1620796.1 hypothetical protein [Aquamicrobium zhengzhouense]